MLSANTLAANDPSHAVHPAFIGQPAFLGAQWGNPNGLSDKRFALVGIPYDGAVTNRPGARFGPQAIRQASLMMCDAIHPLFALSPTPQIVDYGDLVIPTTARSFAAQAIESGLLPFFKPSPSINPHLCVIGGDHSITLSLLRLHFKKIGKPLAVVHFDAHCDTWEDHFSEPSGHGTWVYEAVTEGLIDPRKVIQIGLRSAGDPKTINYIADRGGIIQSAHSLRGIEGAALMQNIREIHERIGNDPVYLTVDIDCLDPAFAPGTGTPEPAGMTSNQLMSYLESLSLPWVGMDCVEVSPIYDHAQITALTAAQVVWTYMCRELINNPH